MPRALFDVCGIAGIVWVAARSAIQSVSAMPPQMTGSGWTTSTARRPSSSTAALRDWRISPPASAMSSAARRCS